MATVTKTYTENTYSSNRATWTVTYTGTNVTASSSTFTLATPVVKAKFSGGGTATRTGAANLYLYLYESGGDDIADLDYQRLEFSLSAGTEFQLPIRYITDYRGQTVTTITCDTSRLFSSSNPTAKTVNILGGASGSGGYISLGRFNSSYTEINSYNGNTGSLGTLATVTLNAPPTVTLGTPTYTSPQYAGFGVYTVPITLARAQYGGNITKAVLTVGSDSKTLTYSTSSITNRTISVTPTVAGTYTPTLAITDSREQTTTTSLQPIVVNPYNVPAVNMSVFRVDDNAIRADEGHLCLIDASISYTSAIATLTAPSVKIDGIAISQQAGASVTWYTNWDNTSGVSGAISDWSALTPINDSVKVYGLIDWSYSTTGKFAEDKSYQITVQETDSLGKASTAISQTLSTAFYTIDFQAGGKEIAFGKPANDTLTQNQENIGLFKCGMEAQFKDAVVIERLVGEIKAYAGATVPTGWLECDGSAISRTDYPLLFDAIGTLWGAGDGSTTFNLPNLKGRVPVGQNAGDTDFDTVGENGGSKFIQQHSHSHTNPTVNGGSHRHAESGSNVCYSSNASKIAAKGSNYLWKTNAGYYTGYDGGHTHTVSGGSVGNINTSGLSTGNAGNLQPYAVVKYIICAV